MKKTFLIISLFVSGSSLRAQGNGTAQFASLTGRWEGTMGKAVLVENWKIQDENTLAGEGYVIANGDTIVRETLSIRKFGDYWTYVPIVNGQKPVLFTLVESSADHWVFENEEHDFPKRIVYTVLPGGKMNASIEGGRKKEEYSFSRVSQ